MDSMMTMRALSALPGWNGQRCATTCRAQAAITLRPGRDEDLTAIRQLILKERMNPLGTWLGADPGRFTCATAVDGRLLGFGQLKEIQGGEAVELSSLVVAPEARGAGIGTQLIADLARRAAGRDVWATTIGARTALYERSGFQEVPLSQAPTPGLLFECLVGAAVAALAARDRLALLRRRGGGDGGEGGSAAAARQEAERRAAGG